MPPCSSSAWSTPAGGAHPRLCRQGRAAPRRRGAGALFRGRHQGHGHPLLRQGEDRPAGRALRAQGRPPLRRGRGRRTHGDPGHPQRPPVLCPGCPHRAVFYVLKKMNLTVAADIGCYTLGAMPPLNAVDSVVCMGASIGMALGLEKARGRDFASTPSPSSATRPSSTPASPALWTWSTTRATPPSSSWTTPPPA